ncbi:MAG: radical SAM protein [Tannerellaceae bacterium]|jgi:uncharacterized protein|nr:radical SAM protein [Tannerellaceae bacterium]
MKPDGRTAALNDNLFVIRRDETTFILYSPLNRKAGVINRSGVNTIARYFEQETLSEKEADYIGLLYENRFLNKTGLPKPIFPDNYSFMPHEVTLFLTSRCNLRCRYCYAEAGKKNEDMAFETARAAIDLVAHNAGLAGLPQFTVGFHGGGEPTMAWELMTETVKYAYQVADDKGLDVEIFAASNGMFNEKQRDFILHNFTNLNISIDGPADIQDYNRPAVNGAGSFAVIRDNLKFFDENDFSYGVRATVTERNVRRMEEVVEWFKAEFNVRYLHIEPVWQCGRCLTSGEKAPSDEDFIQYYIKAYEKAEQLGVNLIYSGLRLDALLSKFCAAPGDGFNVLPDGSVTSCYEITEKEDPKAELFHYGKYDPEKKTFEFEQEKIKRLQQYSVENIAWCRDCFCKWHCAGDCISKVFDESHSFEHQGSSRCKLNRQLTIMQLEKLITNPKNQTI